MTISLSSARAATRPSVEYSAAGVAPSFFSVPSTDCLTAGTPAA